MTLANAAARRKKTASPDHEEAVAARPALLLAWYDRHRRVLPWRPPKGRRADPYAVWLSEIMLQQTGVKTVGPYFEKFLARWPDVAALGRASLDDVLRMWAGLGYYSRARNLHACAVTVLRDHGGVFPDTEEGLRALPGIGPYTAAAIAAIAFDRRTMPVDGNIERVVSRLFAIEEPLPQAKPLVRQFAEDAARRYQRRRREISRRRQCAGADGSRLLDLHAEKAGLQPVPAQRGMRGAPARRSGEHSRARRPKKTGELRQGAAFVVRRGDEILLRTRPEKGLLGGMTEVPGSQWLVAQDAEAALKAGACAKRRRALASPRGRGQSRLHAFSVAACGLYRRCACARVAPKGMRWVPIATLAGEALPNVMRKVIAHGLGE